MLVTKTCERQRSRQWCVAFTEDGLPMYVRTDGVHFFDAREYTGLIAVALTNVDASAEDGRPFSITPSEVYSIEKRDAESIDLIVDSTSQKPGFESRSIVKVKDNPSDFAVINTDDVRDPSPFQPILPVQTGEVVSILMQAFNDRRLTEGQRKQLAEEIKQKFILDGKRCADTVNLDLKFDGQVLVDAGKSFLGLVKSKLGLTGAFAFTSEYPQGLEFASYRFIQNDTEHEAVRFYELWIEKEYEGTGCIDVKLTRVRAKDDADYGGLSGSIDSNDSVGIDFSPTQALPVFRCRDEYLTLIKHLTQTDGELPDETAALLVAHLARFDSGGDPARCPGDGN